MKRLLPWFGAAAILVSLFGTMYAVVQQAQRRAANYPQVQIAEDTAAALDAGASPSTLVTGKVDFSKSLAPFVIVYNKAGQVVTASGYIGGVVPSAPRGILTAASGQPYNSVTWRPESSARVAAVTVAAKDYYVLSGRSLKEVEKDEDRTFLLSLLGGTVALAVLGVIYTTLELLRPKKL